KESLPTNNYIPPPASYPDVSLSMCAQGKAGRRQRARRRFARRLYPSHGPLWFITSHSRFALASAMRKKKRPPPDNYCAVPKSREYKLNVAVVETGFSGFLWRKEGNWEGKRNTTSSPGSSRF
ncbi:unnamed protein product, partial [Porites lobata]